MKFNTDKETLFEEYCYLVPVTVRKMYSQQFLSMHRLTREDLEQVGYIGLMKAIDSYIEGKSKLQTHIINNIKWEVSKMARDHSMFIKNKRTFELVNGTSLNAVVSSEGEDVELQELMDSSCSLGSDGKCSYQEEVIEMEIPFALERIREAVTPRDYEIILDKANGKTLSEIAKDKGITPQSVGRIISRNKDLIYQALFQ